MVCAATCSCEALMELANGTYTPEHAEGSRPCKRKSTSADVKSAGFLHVTSFADRSATFRHFLHLEESRDAVGSI